MKHDAIRHIASRVAATLLLTLLSVAVTCCGGSDREPDTAKAPLEEVPEGIDAKLWSRLTAELERVLAEEGTARRTSEVPTGTGSRVSDLSFYGEGVNSLWTWSHRNQGDYDHNGIVTIADLTPIGIHFGKTFNDPDWITAQYADGDSNGAITIADITPIGQNFGGQVDGYELQSQLGFDGEWTLQEDFPMSSGLPAGGGIPRFTASETLLFPLGTHWRVVSYIQEGGGRTYGPESNLVGGGDIFSAWPTRGRGNGRLGLTSYEGPSSNSEAWSTTVQGAALFNAPIVDAEGTIYFGTYLDPDPDVEGPDTGYIYALNPDGSVRWSYQTDSGVSQQPTMSDRTTIYFTDYKGRLYNFTPDGKLLWRTEHAATFNYGWLQSDSQGNCYAIGFDPGLMISRLNKFDAEGSLLWNRVIPGTTSGPFEDPFGRIGVIGNNADLTFFIEDGTEDQQISMSGSMPFLYNAASYDNRIVLATEGTPNLLQIFELGSPPMEIDLGELEPTGAMGINGSGHIIITQNDNNVIGEQPPASLLAVYDGTGSPLWDLTIGASTFGQITCDASDNMYICGVNSQTASASGIYSYGADQSLRWLYQTQGEFCLQSLVPANGQLLLLLTNFGNDTSRVVLLDSN